MPPAERKEPDLTTYKGRFGLRLKELRERKKLSVVQCVAAFNDLAPKDIHRGTWHSWERGDTAPPLEDLPFVAQSLGFKLHTIMPPE